MPGTEPPHEQSSREQSPHEESRRGGPPRGDSPRGGARQLPAGLVHRSLDTARGLVEAAVPTCAARHLVGAARGAAALLTGVAAVPELTRALRGLRETASHLERLATFTAGELPEAVYQLESIRHQLDGIRQQLTAIELHLTALHPVTSSPDSDLDSDSGPDDTPPHRISPATRRTDSPPPS